MGTVLPDISDKIGKKDLECKPVVSYEKGNRKACPYLSEKVPVNHKLDGNFNHKESKGDLSFKKVKIYEKTEFIQKGSFIDGQNDTGFIERVTNVLYNSNTNKCFAWLFILHLWLFIMSSHVCIKIFDFAYGMVCSIGNYVSVGYNNITRVSLFHDAGLIKYEFDIRPRHNCFKYLDKCLNIFWTRLLNGTHLPKSLTKQGRKPKGKVNYCYQGHDKLPIDQRKMGRLDRVNLGHNGVISKIDLNSHQKVHGFDRLINRKPGLLGPIKYKVDKNTSDDQEDI